MPSSSGWAARDVSPDTFATVASRVALIKTYRCNGTRIGQGTGFLVGTSVVMTARHVVIGACRIHVRVDGENFIGTGWSAWSGGGTSAPRQISRLSSSTMPADSSSASGPPDSRIKFRDGGVSAWESPEPQSGKAHRAREGQRRPADRGRCSVPKEQVAHRSSTTTDESWGSFRSASDRRMSWAADVGRVAWPRSCAMVGTARAPRSVSRLSERRDCRVSWL